MRTATRKKPKKLRAFHGKQSVKKEYLARVTAHEKSDALVQGYGYWRDGKGCAVGCTIHGRNHKRYETAIGVPEVLAHLEDVIFEGLPVADARKWPRQFLSAIRVGADLSRVHHQFLAWLLSKKTGLLTFTAGNRVAISNVQSLHARAAKGKRVSIEEWRSAAAVARETGDTSGSSAESAWVAVWTTASESRAAAYAAEDAASSRWEAEEAAWQKMSRKLLSLLRAA